MKSYYLNQRIKGPEIPVLEFENDRLFH